jgi:hypothetical protein
MRRYRAFHKGRTGWIIRVDRENYVGRMICWQFFLFNPNVFFSFFYHLYDFEDWFILALLSPVQLASIFVFHCRDLYFDILHLPYEFKGWSCTSCLFLIPKSFIRASFQGKCDTSVASTMQSFQSTPYLSSSL